MAADAPHLGARHLAALVELHPAKAKSQVLAALRRARGNISHAAVELGVGRTTLQRLLDRLELRDAVAKTWPRADR